MQDDVFRSGINATMEQSLSNYLLCRKIDIDRVYGEKYFPQGHFLIAKSKINWDELLC